MKQGYGRWRDAEAGEASAPLYPLMMESPELRWAFIRKVYSILSIQLLLTVVVAGTVVSIPKISRFFVSSGQGFAVYIFIVILPFIVLCALSAYSKHHPLNLFLLGIFTVAISTAVGLTCAFTAGKVILEAAILTLVVVVSLTLYTFWASRRGQDFHFLTPILFSAVLVLLIFGLIQVFFPLGKPGMMIYGALGAIVFSAYVILDTDNLIKRHTYDEYIWASAALYLDIVNLFLSLLNFFRASES